MVFTICCIIASMNLAFTMTPSSLVNSFVKTPGVEAGEYRPNCFYTPVRPVRSLVKNISQMNLAFMAAGL
jgi:hypothetical protein